MRKRKFWKTGVAIAVVLSMQTDVAVYAVNTDGEVQVTQENDITQEDNEAAVIEEKNPETADAEVDSTEENVTEDVLTVEYDTEMQAPAAEEKQVGWKKEDDGWYYYNNDGNLKTGWLQLGETYYYLDGNDPEHPGRMACDEKKTINGYNYFFNTSGAMQTGWVRRPEGWYYAYPGGNQQFGWLQIGNNYYYLDKNDEYSGKMVADEKKTINGYNYFFEGGGVMQSGWVRRPEGWYYAYPGGNQRFGWVKTGGYWYYLDQNNEEYSGLMAHDQTLIIGNTEYVFKSGGAMYTGWRYVSGEGYYYYDENSGQKISGWKSVNGNWYYLDPSNNKIMVSNSWKQINGYWYYFVSSGEMAKGWKYINGNYYYLANDGVMRTGWQDIDGYRYYFYKENEAGGWGVMAHDTTINGIAIDSSGHAKVYSTRMAVFSTVSTNNANGTYNMTKALLSFNQVVLQPGQTLSFFAVAGPCGKAQGYKEAGVVGGTGYGGGICQASTTLYGAAIRAGMTIVQRRNHSVPSTYVPIGQDAMVDYGSSDLKFRNDFNFPVKIVTYVSGKTLYAEIWGLQPTWYDYINVSSWSTGAKSAAACRYYIKNGSVVKTEQLPSSYYK